MKLAIITKQLVIVYILSGCAPAFLVPKVKGYHNKDYVVTTECAKDFARTISLYEAVGFDNKAIKDIERVVSTIIREKNPSDKNKTNKTLQFSSADDKSYTFVISKSYDYLQLVLVEYTHEGITLSNSMTGEKKHPLKGCKAL